MCYLAERGTFRVKGVRINRLRRTPKIGQRCGSAPLDRGVANPLKQVASPLWWERDDP